MEELILKVLEMIHLSPVLAVGILSVLLAVSEVLGSLSWFKSSSVFEFVVNVLKSLKEKLVGKK